MNRDILNPDDKKKWSRFSGSLFQIRDGTPLWQTCSHVQQDTTTSPSVLDSLPLPSAPMPARWRFEMQQCSSEASLNIAPSAQADLLYLSVSFQRRCQPALNTRHVVFVTLELLCFFLGASPSARSTTTTDPTPEEMEVAIVIDLCQTSGFRQALLLNRLIPFCWQGSTDRKIQLGCGKERVQLNPTLALWSLDDWFV